MCVQFGDHGRGDYTDPAVHCHHLMKAKMQKEREREEKEEKGIDCAPVDTHCFLSLSLSLSLLPNRKTEMERKKSLFRVLIGGYFVWSAKEEEVERK